MDLELRPWTPDEDELVVGAVERAFLDERRAEAAEPLAVLEHDRTLALWDDGRPVGTAGAFSHTMALPGGVGPVAGVTFVSVQPTHRRRGLLRRLMQAQLEHLHAAGEPLAALWASEPAIYGRFGYGAASRSLAVELRRGDALRERFDAPDVVETTPADARVQLADVWERSYVDRPGEYARNDAWWEHRLWDPEHRRDGATALRCALLADSSGYALYATKGSWDHRGPAGEVTVRELVAVDGPGRLRLWQHVLDHDLAVVWRSSRVALDDVLLAAVRDQRRLTARVQDGLFVRPVRVGEALEARTYSTELDVVLDVADQQLPDNARRWRLSGGPDGATCAPTSDPADLSLGVEELGAAYLGGTTLNALGSAGRVVEHRPGALRAASRALRGDVEPMCTHVF